ncbi:small ribosomal subunit protein uS2m-like [Convolutriloba macropyga]|uniref:small ribosomal subunit protein uS2m-like n=1 Tax=Convolutriloba macropyga TaxID=536237 RepID=UPI003F525D1D
MNWLRVRLQSRLAGRGFCNQYFSSRMLALLAAKTRSNIDVQLEKFYLESLKHDDFFKVKSLVTLPDCFKANMHLGHKRDCWNDGFNEYVFGNRLDIDIINLEKTVERLRNALNVIAHIVFRNGIVLFVLRPGHRECHFVDQQALDVGEYSNTRQWRDTFLSSRAASYEENVRVPDLIVLFSCHNSIFAPHPCLKEASNLGIVTVGLVDSNCDPRLVSYPVPGNDDSPSSVRHFGSLVAAAILAGKRERAKLLTSLGVPTRLEDLFSYSSKDVSSSEKYGVIHQQTES